MAGDGWQCQGRQDHGWFGSGTCGGGAQDGAPDRADAGLSRAIDAAACAALGHLRGTEGRSYERWLHEGGLVRLRGLVPGWMAGARLDPEAFRTRFFGPNGSATVAAHAQALAVGLRAATQGQSGVGTHPDASASLADLVRNVGSGNLGLTLIRAQGALEASAKPASGTPRPENTEQNVMELASVMQSEAGGEPGDAPKVAVGFTIVNRMHRNGTLNVHDVWGQYGHSVSPTSEIIALAREVLSGGIADPTNGATHFYTPKIMSKKGEKRHGDTGGGLESVKGVEKHGKPIENYKPRWTNSFERKEVPNIPESSFKFYKMPENAGKVL